MGKIPDFFAKALSSPIPIDRFRQLVQEGASSSFISPTDLKTLCVSGLAAGIDEALRERPLTAAEERRIGELRDAFGLTIDDLGAVDDRLLKAAILRDLDANIVPDRIEIAGEIPVKLRPEEAVLWIFNDVVAFKPPLQAEQATQDPGNGMKFPLNTSHLPATERGASEGTGDLLVTTTALHFVAGPTSRRIPALRISGLHAHRDGVRVAYRAAKLQSRVFILDDVWFAASLIARVVGRGLPMDAGVAEQEAAAEMDTPDSGVI